jgi:hypothetical protein
MPNTLIAIFVIVSIFVVFSPIYLQRRKLWRMADEDLKRIDYDEWKRQMKSNAYIKLGSRLIWGLFLISGFFINFWKIVETGFNPLRVFILILGLAFIVWGILGFRLEIKKIREIQ